MPILKNESIKRHYEKARLKIAMKKRHWKWVLRGFIQGKVEKEAWVQFNEPDSYQYKELQEEKQRREYGKT